MDVRRRTIFGKRASSSGGGSTTSGSYTVNLNGQWQKSSTISNPDSSTYDGVYESYSNKGVNSSAAVMCIDISGLSEFKLYIRSYAESNYDYVMVSQLDQTITNDSSYSNTTLVKAHTRGNQQSGTGISNYTLVEFTGIDKGSHRITVLYRKDGSAHSNADRGYVLIPKNQDSSGGGSGEVTPMDNYLTIVALEDGLSVSLSKSCQYCINGDGNWKSLIAGTTTNAISTGQTLSFKGNLTPTLNTGIGTFSISKKCNLKGNVMSMLFGDNAATNTSLSGKGYAFYKLFYNCTNIVDASELLLPATTLDINCYAYMFYNCTNLTSAPELPATTLANYCYSYMLWGCTSLTTAPELPATTLDSNCYTKMFYGCTSLTTAPELPATTLAGNCYECMFEGCSSLTEAPELPATTLAGGCYAYMFYGCTGLTTASELPATTLANRCCELMFYGCTSLTTAPELPATMLTDYCYYCMFRGCKKLKYIKMLATDISASSCLSEWVAAVSSTGTFVKNKNATWDVTGSSGIPTGWTVITA